MWERPRMSARCTAWESVKPLTLRQQIAAAEAHRPRGAALRPICRP
ncbi:hypothetical protein GHK48_25440 [Sinorhizobium fredii]|uniref:Uncharacterized protein n=1 Tax=Rhizobium fredii TaxID=380 RepID=A0A844AEY8_RHIFR|nr:hypothetical protein [Sinorhizobium fredii]